MTTTNEPPGPSGAAQRITASLSAKGSNQRISQSPGRAQMLAGGMGYIARRGVSTQLSMMLRTTVGIEFMANFQPMQLLMLMADMVPEISNGLWNFLLLGTGPGKVTLKAMTKGADGKEEEAPDGTAEIDRMFNAQPHEAGGFLQQLAMNVAMVLFSGLSATEAVPGAEHQGIVSTWPVDTLSLAFRRAKDMLLVLDQRQSGPNLDVSASATNAGFAGSNMVPMPMDRFFYRALHSFPGDPYGRAPFGAALPPLLDYLAFMRDLTIAFHRVGMPRYDVEFDFDAAVTLAVKVKQMTDPTEIANDVKDQFDKFVADFTTLEIDDAFFHSKGTEVSTTGTGKEMPDCSAIFDIYRYRVIIGLKQNPVLMSFVEGSTETWSDIQWELFTAGLHAVVEAGAEPLIESAQLHLQLLGMPYKVVAVYKSPRSISRLEDAKAEQTEIANEIAKRDQGWQTQDTASSNITGSAAVADAPAPVSIIPAGPAKPAFIPGSEPDEDPKTDQPETPPKKAPAPAKPEVPPHKRANKKGDQRK